MKHYDQAYFDRWYRRPSSRIDTPTNLRRRARLAIAIAERMLGGTLRNVLDVGCGEGRWRAALRKERPGIDYTGVESSAWAVERFGRARKIIRGSFGSLPEIALPDAIDLALCIDVLHYVEARDIDRGLAALVPRIRGVAYLDVTTIEDHPVGDLDGWHRRRAAWYHDRFMRAGLHPIGLGFWIPEENTERLSAAERVGLAEP